MTPTIVAEELQKEYFNSLLKMMTKINKSVRPEQLSELMKFAKLYATKRVDFIINNVLSEMLYADTEGTGRDFWESVKIEING